MDSCYRLSTYRYALPEEKIAQSAVHPPESAKMLRFSREMDDVSNSADFVDSRFNELPALAWSERLFVFNDTRVIPSRVHFSNAVFTNRDGFRREKSGEIFFLREIPPEEGGLKHEEEIGVGKGAARKRPRREAGSASDDITQGRRRNESSIPPCGLFAIASPLPDSSSPRFEALVFPGAAFSTGSKIELGNFVLEVESKIPDGRTLRIVSGGSVHDFLAAHGKLPLPPYVEYSDEKALDYQTEFAKKEGSLAAPTASLHFTERLISQIRAAGSSVRFLTLHVGLWTFKPVRVDDIREHEMHPEFFEVSASIFSDVVTAKREGKKVVGVGTTVIRTLESLPYVWRTVNESARTGDADCADFLARLSEEVHVFWNRASSELRADYHPEEILSVGESGISGTTRLFLMPGSKFLVVDEIVTNFHLPESTLLVLVSAFAGIKKAREAYAHALSNGYRFYSFGDGMWVG